jgi:hypothetical protein
VSERRAILEKVVAQVDPFANTGKADIAVGTSEETSCSCCAGVVATACTQGKRTQHGKPFNVVGCDDQPEIGDDQIGRYRVAERPVVPMKPGNADGGKGP